MGGYVSLWMQFLGDILSMSPLVKANAVAADGLFCQVLIVKLGFVNPRFFLWHLLDSGLMRMSGEGGYELLQGH